MNKRKAKEEAYSNTKTWEHFLGMIEKTRGTREMSKVNKSLTLDQSLGIFVDFIHTRDINEIPTASNSRGGMLAVTNILRECG